MLKNKDKIHFCNNCMYEIHFYGIKLKQFDKYIPYIERGQKEIKIIRCPRCNMSYYVIEKVSDGE